MGQLQDKIEARSQEMDDPEDEIKEEERSSTAPPSPSLPLRKLSAVESRIRLTQDRIQQLELQMRTATPENKAALRLRLAALQQEKVLLLQVQQQQQAQSSARGQCPISHTQ